MKVITERTTSKFKDILYGSVFLWKGNYYMRVGVTYHNAFNEYHPRNAVNIEDGTPCFFVEDELVHDVNGHFEAY